jgi:hypothetical protein
MNQIENRPDTAAMLSTLAGIIREHSVPVDQFVRHICEPIHGGSWEKLGIRRLTSDPLDGNPVIPDQWNSCGIIEFEDWAAVDDASGLWDRLYLDVIKPLKKRDFQFIFHLGDVAKKPVFEIDEVLDIMCDYASYGKVTLILDDYEADNLWCRLNGRNPNASLSGVGSPAAEERYLFLFNTMKADALLVLRGCHAMLFSRNGQFDLAGRCPVSIREVINTRDRFSAGYQMGLWLQLETPYCIALGLAVSGGYPEASSGAGSAIILAYLQDWISGF